MAISDGQKLDYLWKKLGYGVSKTDTNDQKKAPNEAIASPLLIRGDKIWNESQYIPAVKPVSDTLFVGVYDDANATSVECVEDTTSTPRRSWKTELDNWIPPEFGSTYQVKVYVANPGISTAQTSGTQLFATGSGNNDEWFFDYQSGLLHFIGVNLPSSVVSGKSIYIVGARYTGSLGPNANTVSGSFSANTLISQTVITNDLIAANTISATELVLTEVLATEYGGTGLESFDQDGVMVAKSSSKLGFVKGTYGKIFQVGANGHPTFDDVDGGNY
jgi:hypothetical protein